MFYKTEGKRKLAIEYCIFLTENQNIIIQNPDKMRCFALRCNFLKF